MPRRRVIAKRELAADPLYQSPLVTRFINTVMRDGKKNTAEGILYRSFDIIKEKTGDDPLKVFKKAVDNVKPSLEVKSRRVGGSNYQVPVEVNPNRRLSLSIRWLVGFARARGDGKTMQEKLANELLDAANLRGGAVKKRPLSLVRKREEGKGNTNIAERPKVARYRSRGWDPATN
jgi:small subunit ribosomal protein S7